MKVIHHIEISHTSNNISGGETAMLEIIKSFTSIQNLKQVVYTSESGKKVYKKLLGKLGDDIDYITIGNYKIEKFNPYLAYFLRVIEIFFNICKFDDRKDNIIISHEGFLPTSIYSFLLKILNPKSRWFAIFHMKSPSIFKGFEGEYTDRYYFPKLSLIRYKIEEQLFFLISKNKLDTIIPVNIKDEHFLKKIYKNVYTLKIFGGEKSSSYKKYIDLYREKVKKYDICFMGRFHPQKGIFELIDIVKKIKDEISDISVAIMGGGDKKMENKFFQLVKLNGLEKNINYLGYVTGEEKFNILCNSKIFIFPSYYESFPQAVLEAMKCELPVVSYDITPLLVYKKGVIKIPVLNNKLYAESIIKLVKNKKLYNKIKNEARDFAKDFSWDKTSNEIYNLIVKKYV